MSKLASTGRRRLLKSLGAGGGVFAAQELIPTGWTRPVVESVLLPAHAQTTSGPCSGAPVTGEQPFQFTGTVQLFTVPGCVTTIHVVALGAAGGRSGVIEGGLGGRSEGDLPVTPGESLTIIVGGQGQGPGQSTVSGPGGFGGGGDGGNTPGAILAGAAGGGGRSAVERGGVPLIVAGGGGGASNGGSSVRGHGGGTSGANAGGTGGGGGGSNGSGGSGGLGAADNGDGGTATNGGMGGDADGTIDGLAGGGGGGGYGGGGGGGGGGILSIFGAGGGGGGLAPPGGSTSPGVNAGNGSVVITWQAP